MEIKHLRHTKIDKAKWDACIDKAPNGIIYAQSWYLDIVSPGWDALVDGDYESVMPLPWRKKMGIRYIYTPLFVQQLGVFSIKENVKAELFIKSIPLQFKFAEQNLNESNTLPDTKITNIPNVNYKLNIDKKYIEIKKAYNRNCKRNIGKAQKAGFIVKNDVTPTEFSQFVSNNLKEKLHGVLNRDFLILEQLANVVLSRGKGEIVGLRNSENILHAVGFYLYSNKRLIFSVCASSDYGKANQAMSILVDSQIAKYAEKFHWYDFSGSNDKGIAYFNSTFGAFGETYLSIKLNRLPRLLKFLKK